ncbi:MAG: CZB domain-containing protein, partial [Pseudomonadota bacterium]|nr:CZB domain-containing protein [Pseudomonadota bacterium]
SIQGYGIAKPMNEADVDAWINQWKTNQKWSSLKEVAPQNKQLLKARLAHSAWLNKVDKLIKNGDAKKYIQKDSHKTCEFGLWLSSYGIKVLDNQTFQSVDRIHQEIHQLARQALKENDQGKDQINLKGLSLIKEKSTELSKLIKSFEV